MARILLLFQGIFLFCAWPNNVFAYVLTQTELQSAERLGIFLSPFDPPSNTDLAVAERLVAEHHLDYLLLLPSCEPTQTECAPLSHRLQMLELAAKDHPRLRNSEASAAQTNERAYLKAAIAQNLAANVPQTLVFSQNRDHQELIRESSKVSLQILPPEVSFNARDFLRENTDFFFGEAGDFIDRHHPPFPSSVLHYVHRQGLYLLDNGPPESLRPRFATVRKAKVKEWVYQGLRRLALLYVIQSLRGKHRPSPTFPAHHRFVFEGHVFEVASYLGSGSHNDAYIVNVEGQQFVLKIPRGDSDEHLFYSRQTTLTHRWLLYQKMPNIPLLIDYDPEGRWSVAELIQGERMVDRFGGKRELTDGELESFREIFDYTIALYRRSGIRLDISASNLVLREGQVHLVDLGTALDDWFPTGSFEEWVRYLKKTSRSNRVRDHRNEVVLTCARRLLSPFILKHSHDPELRIPNSGRSGILLSGYE